MSKRLITVLGLAILVFCTRSFADTFTVINTDDSGAGSLRQAITDANANLGSDTIDFAIPGAGQKTIALLSELPAIGETVIMDGGNNGDATNRVEVTGGGTLSTGFNLNASTASGSALG